MCIKCRFVTKKNPVCTLSVDYCGTLFIFHDCETISFSYPFSLIMYRLVVYMFCLPLSSC